jgi:hypothetical protein
VTSGTNTHLWVAIGLLRHGSLTFTSNTTNILGQLNKNCIVPAE